MALAVCPNGCDESRAGKRELVVTVDGIEPGVIVYVHDDQGRAVAKEERLRSSRRKLTFRPLGGSAYFLSFGFGHDFGERRANPFIVRVDERR